MRLIPAGLIAAALIVSSMPARALALLTALGGGLGGAIGSASAAALGASGGGTGAVLGANFGHSDGLHEGGGTGIRLTTAAQSRYYDGARHDPGLHVAHDRRDRGHRRDDD